MCVSLEENGCGSMQTSRAGSSGRCHMPHALAAGAIWQWHALASIHIEEDYF